LKFGVRLPNSGPLADRLNIVRTAEESEKLGFHSVWVHDHILWGVQEHRGHISAGAAEALNRAQEPNFYESVTTVSYLSGKCESINFGIAVVILPLRNPLVLGKQLANLDVLSRGRLMVGVAPGAPNITKPEFEAVGVSYHERGKITDEYISVLRRLWREPNPSYSGRYISFNDAQLFPKPSSNLKLLIGGGERGISERALRRVVELGDGWVPAYLTPEEIRVGVDKVKQECQKVGRTCDQMIVVHEMFTCLGDETSLIQRAAPTIQKNFSSLEEGEKRSLLGSPNKIIKKLETYVDAGVTLTELKFIYPDLQTLSQMLRTFSSEIMPCFS
jgi:probable F420-dependent oxidoreductase